MNSLSVIVPSYNFEKSIINNLLRLEKKIKSFKIKYEIIVVDDGSNDKTQIKLKQNRSKFKNLKLIILKKNYGKGYAIKKGFQSASKKIIIFIDCDLPYLSKLNSVYKNICKKENDLVIISRAKENIKKIHSKNSRLKFRRFLSRLAYYVITRFIVKNIRDTQSGLKAIKSKYKSKLINYKTNGFAFDLEILAKAQKHNLKIKQIYANSKSQDYSSRIFFDIIYYLKFITELGILMLMKFFNKI